MDSSKTNSRWWPAFLAGVALLVSCSVAFAANVESSVKLTKTSGTASLTNSYCGDAFPTNTACCDYSYEPPSNDISCGFVLFYFTATEAGTATLQVSGSGPTNLFFSSSSSCNSSEGGQLYNLSLPTTVTTNVTAGETVCYYFGSPYNNNAPSGAEYPTGTVTLNYQIPIAAVLGPVNPTDGPIPPWAYAVLAIAMFLISRKRLGSRLGKNEPRGI